MGDEQRPVMEWISAPGKPQGSIAVQRKAMEVRVRQAAPLETHCFVGGQLGERTAGSW